MSETRLPWSFEQKALDFLKPGLRILDIGGQYAQSLGFASEQATAGETVLPFEDGSFDLILAYHALFDPKEAARVLRRGGFLVTQQIGGRNLPDRPDYNLENQAPVFQAAGFRLMYTHQAYVPGEEDLLLRHRFIIIGKKS